MRKIVFLTSSVLLALFHFGWASATTAARSGDLQKSYTVEKGTVISVTEVSIDNTQGNDSGAIGGAGSGALSGAFIDEGIEGAIAGALVCGLLGGTVEHFVGKEKGYELDVRKSDGTATRILQRKQTLKGIAVGEEIELMTDADGTTLVKRLNQELSL